MAILVEGSKPYTAGDGIGIDTNKVISVLLRAEDNLIKLNTDNELYTDLQLADGIEPEDELPVGITVGKVLEDDGWEQNGLLLNWKTTSGDYARWIYGADGEIYFDGGTGEWKQVYYSDEVDALFTELRNSLATVAFTGDYNDLINRPEMPVVFDGELTITQNGTSVGTFTANQQQDETINITVPTKTSDLTNDSGYIDNTVDDLVNYTKTSDLAAVALSNDYDDLNDKPTIGNATITIQKNSSNVDTFTTNATADKTININMDKTDVGLGNVDNTSDVNKPISTATQAALDLKANTADLATVATTGDYDDLLDKPTIGNATITLQKNGTDVNTFTTNATSNKTINLTLDKSDVGLGNVNNTSDLDKPISTATQSALDLKANSADLATVATTGSYADLSNKPTIGDGTITIQKNGTAVDTFTTNQTSAKSINITMTKSDVGLSNVDNTSDANKPISTATQNALNLKANTADLAAVATSGAYSDLSGTPSLATVATTGDYDDLTDKPTIPTVINSLTSTDTSNALSAAQGKILNDKIADLQSLGKFLSLWDCATGLPISFPHQTPYTYSTGDYFLVENVGTTTNYRPTGSSYTGAASTVVETDEIEIGDMYIYDGSVWLLQINHGKSVSFANLTGQPSDNAALSTALDAKQNNLATQTAYTSKGTASKVPQITTNTLGQVTGITEVNISYPSQVSDTAYAASWNGVTSTAPSKNAVYDKISAMDTTISGKADSSSLATVATSGSYNDLTDKPSIPSGQVQSDWTQTTTTAVDYIKNKPNLATVATSGSYNDLSNKPTIPAAQVQTDWNATSGMASIANKPSLATVATSGAYSDLSGTPSLATVATSGSYSDLSNKPSIPAAQVQTDWNATTGMGVLLNKPSLATVATSGSYNDLSNKPTIPAAQVNSDWNASSGVAQILNKPTIPTVNNATLTVTQNGTSKGTFTANASSNVTIEVKDTTYESKTASSGGTAVSLVTTGEKYTWNNKQDTISDLATIRSGASAGATAVQPGSLATVATSGSYNDLSNKPTIPSVNNSTITFTQNGTSKGDITLNQSSAETIALTDTTYSNITKSEIQTGTASTQRTISASVITSALPRISGLPNNILTNCELWAGTLSDYKAMGSGRPSTTFFFCIDDGGLPSEYQEVEYIENTGATGSSYQYIDTGVTINVNTNVSIELGITPNTSYISENAVLGTDWSGSTYFLMFYSSKWRWHSMGGNVDNSVSPTATNHTVILTNNSISVDGTTSSFTKGNSYDGTGSILLFAVRGFSANPSRYKPAVFKCHGMKMYDGSSLIRDFVPCYRKSDSVIGMYDLVNSVFYTNAGTGTFTKGPDVN